MGVLVLLVQQFDFQSLLIDYIILDGAGDTVSRPPGPIRTTFLTLAHMWMCRLLRRGASPRSSAVTRPTG